MDYAYIGRSEYDAPDVDGVVYVRSKVPLKAGDFVQVMITDAYEYDLAGVVQMNLPNILTISRIVLAIVLVFLLEQSSSNGQYFGGQLFLRSLP